MAKINYILAKILNDGTAIAVQYKGIIVSIGLWATSVLVAQVSWHLECQMFF